VVVHILPRLPILRPPPNYPEATYLWTWYAPQDGTGTQSRPITFMQSQSGVNVGTSLALADYYYYQNFQQPIDPSNFDIPTVRHADAEDRAAAQTAVAEGPWDPQGTRLIHHPDREIA
jgi:hypothetical protein